MKIFTSIFILSLLLPFNLNAGLLGDAFTPRIYYPTLLVGWTGTITISNDGKYKAQFGVGNMNFQNHTAHLVKTLKNGVTEYRSVKNNATFIYYVSKDRSNITEVALLGEKWVCTTWYVDSKEEQMAFYKANKQYQRNGLTFDYSWTDSSGDTHSSKPNGQSNCSKCHGTGIDPTPTGVYGYSNWAAHYNRKGDKCRICGKYTEHFHQRCPSCNVPRN